MTKRPTLGELARGKRYKTHSDSLEGECRLTDVVVHTLEKLENLGASLEKAPSLPRVTPATTAFPESALLK
jgi:hypothetical protein